MHFNHWKTIFTKGLLVCLTLGLFSVTWMLWQSNALQLQSAKAAGGTSYSESWNATEGVYVGQGAGTWHYGFPARDAGVTCAQAGTATTLNCFFTVTRWSVTGEIGNEGPTASDTCSIASADWIMYGGKEWSLQVSVKSNVRPENANRYWIILRENTIPTRSRPVPSPGYTDMATANPARDISGMMPYTAYQTANISTAKLECIVQAGGVDNPTQIIYHETLDVPVQPPPPTPTPFTR